MTDNTNQDRIEKKIDSIAESQREMSTKIVEFGFMYKEAKNTGDKNTEAILEISKDIDLIKIHQNENRGRDDAFKYIATGAGALLVTVVGYFTTSINSKLSDFNGKIDSQQAITSNHGAQLAEHSARITGVQDKVVEFKSEKREQR